jgi:hypothetical protein
MSLTLDGSNGVTVPEGAVYNGLQQGTAVATTSGTSITFSSIPSWVKRITVMFNGVSTSGTSLVQVQIGSGSVTTTGYTSYANYAGGANASGGGTSTTGFLVDDTANASSTRFGSLVLVNIGSNIWVSAGSGGLVASSAYYGFSSGGSITLSGTLDRVVLTTVNGTDTFDNGSVNIIYE